MRSILPKMSFFMAIFMGFGLFANAQNIVFEENAQTDGFKIQSSSKGEIVLSHAIHQFELSDVQIEGNMMKQVNYGLSFIPSQEGAPDLPSFSRYLLIPNGAQVKLNIISEEKETFDNIDIAPAAAIPFETQESVPAVKGNVYQKDAFFPSEIYQSDVTEVRGMTMAVVAFNPFQYNPVTKELVVYKNVEFEVEIIGGNGLYGENRFRSRHWDQILDDLVYNANDIPEVDYAKMAANRKDDNGCEYLIVVPDQADFITWADSIKLFRTEQGIDTKVVTISEVGGNTVEGIKDYFDNIYETWDPVPAGVLLMADYSNDASGITSKTYPHPYSGNFITDNYYADYTGNDLPDFVFARMTARNYTELETMVNKFLVYERTPPTNFDFYNKPITALGWQTERWFQICSETVGGYMKNVLGKDPVRINAVYDGNPNSDPWSTATNTAQVVNYFGPMGVGYIPATPAELGGWSGGSANDVVNAINDGAFILQHRDHGMESGWGEPAFTSSYCNQLNNVDELTHIFSINCLTGRFDVSGECFAEKFHRYNNGGALSLTAASQVSYSFVNDAYVWGLFDNMWTDYMPDYGGTNIQERDFLPAFGNAAGKYFLSYTNWPYNTNNKQITYRLFHHHGDAFNTIYTEVPEEMDIVYSEVLVSGPDYIDIQTEEGAMIAFSVDGSLIGIGIGTGNSEPITIEMQTPGTMIKVVVTKQNYFRYEGWIQVIAPDGPYIIKSGFAIDDSQGNTNGLVDYGEDILLDFSVKNLGTEVAESVEVSISCDDDLITFTDDQESFGDVAVDEEITHTGAFSFSIAEDIPDNYNFSFDFSATNGTDVWESSFSVKAYAPVLEILSMDIIEVDGNGNGRIDAGEEAILSIEIENNGHAASPEGLTNILSSSNYVTLNSDEVSFETIDSAGIITAEFNIETSDDTPIGSVIGINSTVEAGSYTHAKDFAFSVGLIVEDWETGDFGQFDWMFDDEADWNIDNMVYYEGENSVKSGSIGDNQQSTFYLNYDVMVDDNVSFFYKVSSESGYDKLKFYIDGTMKGSWDGEVAWTEASYPVTAGSHEFKWTYDKDGSQSNGQDCAWVDFIVLPPMLLPSSNAGDDVEICNTESTYQLQASAADYESIEWSTSGDGSFSAIDILDPVYTIGSDDLSNGMVILSLTAFSGNNQVTNNMVLELASDPVQPPMPQGETQVCYAAEGMTYTVEDISSGYEWYLSPEDAGTLSSIANTVYIDFAEDFNGEVSLSAASNNACGISTASEALSITVSEQAAIMFNGDTETCFGSEAILSLELSGMGPWQVEMMDDNGAEIFFDADTSPYEITINPEATTTYTLMNVIDVNGCTGMADGSAIVTVDELPTGTLSAEDAEVCAGEMVEIDITLTGVAPWQVVVGDAANEQEFEVLNSSDFIEFMAPMESVQLEFISITDANECMGTGEGQTYITVMESPMVDLGVDTTICHNHTYNLDAGNSGSTYSWSTGDDSQSIIVDFDMADANGDLVVSVDVMNSIGCAGNDEVFIHFDDCTGIDELSANDIEIMPNPNNGQFILELGAFANSIKDITIHNSLGELVLQIAASQINEHMDIDLSHLADGVYFVMIHQETQQVSKRFIIRK